MVGSQSLMDDGSTVVLVVVKEAQAASFQYWRFFREGGASSDGLRETVRFFGFCQLSKDLSTNIELVIN